MTDMIPAKVNPEGTDASQRVEDMELDTITAQLRANVEVKDKKEWFTELKQVFSGYVRIFSL